MIISCQKLVTTYSAAWAVMEEESDIAQQTCQFRTAESDRSSPEKAQTQCGQSLKYRLYSLHDQINNC